MAVLFVPLIQAPPSTGGQPLPVRYSAEGWVVTPQPGLSSDLTDELPAFPDDLLGPAIVRHVRAQSTGSDLPRC